MIIINDEATFPLLKDEEEQMPEVNNWLLVHCLVNMKGQGNKRLH